MPRLLARESLCLMTFCLMLSLFTATSSAASNSAKEATDSPPGTFTCGTVVAPEEVTVLVGETIRIPIELIDRPQTTDCNEDNFKLQVLWTENSSNIEFVRYIPMSPDRELVEVRGLSASTGHLIFIWNVRICLSGNCAVTRQFETFVRVIVDGQAQPDLAVTQLKATTVTDQFENLAIKALGVNLGDRGLPTASQENLRVSIGGVDHGSLDEWCSATEWDGAGCSLDTAVQVAVGTWEVEVCADPDQSVALEANPWNNCQRTTLAVPPLQPDLAVIGVTILPPSPKVGELATVRVTVRNQGNLNSPPYQLRLSTPDGDEIRQLQAHGWGWNFETDFDWTPTREGSNELQAVVDPAMLVADHDRSNNDRALTVSVLQSATQAPKPDLVFPANPLTVSPSSPHDGDEISLTVVMLNGGPGPTPEGVEPNFKVTVAGTAHPVLACPRLSSGATCTVQMPIGRLPAGTHTVELTADPLDLIWEGLSGEANNTAQDTLTVIEDSASLADLMVRANSIRMIPASPQAGDSVTFELELWNSGAETPSFAAVEAGGSWFGDPKIHPCAPAPVSSATSCTVFEMTWNGIPAGYHSVVFEADPRQQIAESDEGNNNFPFHFFVGGGSGGTVSCQGVWTLTERVSGQVSSGTGSVEDGCHVYWGANQPTGVCLQTHGSGGLTVLWSDFDGDDCPDLAFVSSGHTYDVHISSP